ncbi:MAG TPA: enolase C-terminal domain-like protein, partial [Gemmatimonadota bacterium]|nr:enolase C-terminal domain-like protein [Gemmatimonadota bacterium]
RPEALRAGASGHVDPGQAWDVMMANEKPGGHGDRSVAVAALDMALWDLAAKAEGKPLHRLLAERFCGGAAEEVVEVYAAGGYYYPGKDLSALQDEIRGYLDAGYRQVKVKIGGEPLEDDLRRIEAALHVLGRGEALAVDANGRFDRDTALRYADALAPYGLRWYEEPGDPLDFDLLAEVSAASATPLATGENLFSLGESRNLVRYGGLRPRRDFLQMDPGLCYGLVEYLRILDMLQRHGWSPRRCVPHGGHQFALHIAGGLGLGGNESYPGVFQPFGGFADGVPVEDGRVRLPESPGIGIELKADLFREYQKLLG